MAGAFVGPAGGLVGPAGGSIDDLRTRLRQELHDEDAANYRWSDSELDRHLTRAVNELSLSLPREVKTGLTTVVNSRDLNISTLSDLVRIEAVEYPAGEWPAAYAPFSIYGGVLTLQVDRLPAGPERVYVYWGALHELDAYQSTLPAAVEEVVLTGAAGYAAMEWASFATNRANVGGPAAFQDYETWGEGRLSRFRSQLSELGARARVRSRRLYAASGASGRTIS